MIHRACFHPKPRRVAILSLLAMAAFAACDQGFNDHPPVYPVKGKVLYQGRPISGGVVVYELETGDPSASSPAQGNGPFRATGRIEPDGGFRLVAFAGAEGVPEGNYKVGISSMPARSEANILDSAGSAKKGNPDVLRGRYADPKSSGLRAQVAKDQPNEPTFNLK